MVYAILNRKPELKSTCWKTFINKDWINMSGYTCSTYFDISTILAFRQDIKWLIDWLIGV
jgi:hypothetical protein